jgi:RNA polymerase sigma-70 factor (ECF subfamily)
VDDDMADATVSDSDLVLRACRGDTDAFADLVDRYQDYIYNAVVHMVGPSADAEDLAQEAFLKAFRSLKGFRREAEFSTWLYGIMLNCVRSHWRRQGRRKDAASLTDKAAANGAMNEPRSPEDDPFAHSVRAETVAAVRKAIAGLDTELREVIVMRDIQGLSYQQLAQTLRLPLGTVKSRLFRARFALKERISPALAGEMD